MKRGEIWWAYMGEGEGSEQAGDRPVLIIQNDVGNEHSPTIIVAAMTDSHKRWMPTHVKISSRCGLGKDSVILLEQLRTIAKSRFTKRIAVAPEYVMQQVDHTLAVSIGLKLKIT